MTERTLMDEGDARTLATRRAVLAGGAGLLALAAVRPARATPAAMQAAIRDFTGGAKVDTGGVILDIPALVENGNSVPLKIKVVSPMTEADHVNAIHVIADRNPRSLVATFNLGPGSGRAEVTTRIRLAGSQRLTVLAALSGNRYRISQQDVLVTSAACLDDSL